MVLGSLAWRSDSPLFDAIELKGSVPCYDDVCCVVCVCMCGMCRICMCGVCGGR